MNYATVHDTAQPAVEFALLQYLCVLGTLRS